MNTDQELKLNLKFPIITFPILAKV